MRFHRVLGCLAIAVGVLLPAAPAVAEPSPAELEQQIDRAHDQLEPVIEEYNRITEELVGTQAAVVDLEAKIKVLQGKVDEAQIDVSRIAASAYRTGGGIGAAGFLLSTSTSGSLARQVEAMERVSRARSHDLATFTRARTDFAAERRRLGALETTQTRQQSEIAAKKAAIEAEIARLEAMEARLPANRSGGSAAAPAPAGPPGGTGRGAAAVRFAYAQLGKMYRFGAAGPNQFDCSGLTQMAWRTAGVSLPHNAAAQYRRGPRIARNQLLPGDLVYYNNLAHVGIYIGNGQIIHAPRTGKPVAVRALDVMKPYGFTRPG